MRLGVNGLASVTATAHSVCVMMDTDSTDTIPAPSHTATTLPPPRERDTVRVPGPTVLEQLAAARARQAEELARLQRTMDAVERLEALLAAGEEEIECEVVL